MSQNVNVSNATNSVVNVFPSVSTGWQLADIFTNVALLFTGIGEVEDAVEAVVDFPKAIETIDELVDAVKIIANLAKSGASVYNDNKDTMDSIKQFLQQSCITIQPSTFSDVLQTGGFDYLSPSGLAGLAGANTVVLYVFNSDLSESACISSGDDISWMVQPSENGGSQVIQVQYGHIWVANPGSSPTPIQ